MLGKTIRMNRLLDSKHGRYVGILVDHTIARGLQPGLMNIDYKLGQIVAGGPKAITMHKGIAEKVFPKYADSGVSLILKASSPSQYNPTCHAFIADLNEAVAYGADAVAIGGIFCGKDQLVQMEHIGAITREANKLGMPVIGHIYPNGEAIEKSKREEWQNVAYAARAGAELGVDILKVHHSGNPDEFAKIVECVPAPVVLAGGSAGTKISDYLEMARNALDAGGAGVAFGRFVWSYPHVPELIRAIKYMVIEDTSVKEAMELLAELEAKCGEK